MKNKSISFIFSLLFISLIGFPLATVHAEAEAKHETINPGFDDIEISFVAIEPFLVEMTAMNPGCEIQYVKAWLNDIFLSDLGAYEGVFTYVFNLQELSEEHYFDFIFVCDLGISTNYNVTYDFLLEIAEGYELPLASNTYIYTTGTNEAVTLLWDVVPQAERSEILGCNVFKRTTPDDDLVQLNEELISSVDGHYRFTDETPSDPDIPPYYEIWLIGTDDSLLLTDIEAHWLLNFKPKSQTILKMYISHWDPDFDPEEPRELTYLKIFLDGIFVGDYGWDPETPIFLPLDDYFYPGACYDFVPVYPTGMGPAFEVCDYFIQYMLSFFVPFPSPGASWHYDYANFWVVGYVHINHVGDTVINGKAAGKLEKEWYAYNIENQSHYNQHLGYEYMYADDERVYVYRHNQFYVLWDFSATPGDSWEIPESFDAGCDSTASATVVATGDTLINGHTLRYIELDWNTDLNWAYHGLIVERIGPLQDYLFPHPTCITDLFEGGPLRCYSDNNIGLYETGFAEACDFIVGMGENTRSSDFSIAPNPAKEDIMIQFDLKVSGDVLIEVFSMDGCILYSRSETNLSSGSQILSFKTTPMAPGVYILKLSTAEGVSSKRLLIQ
jgi:hypothetical protein